MGRKSKKIKNKKAIPARASGGEAKAIGPNGWGFQQIGLENYCFLVVGVFSQIATILITWPAWQVRESPPNLPWIAMTPQLSCGVILLVSLVLVLMSPRKFGMVGFLAVLGFAIGMDQFRCQPQVLAIAFMMAACVWLPARRLCLWFLISIWMWAGIHKLISVEWFTFISYDLLSQTSVNPNGLHRGFALLIGLSELGLAIAAWSRPRQVMLGCLALHCGIVVFLLCIGWNNSVIPWNLCTAIVGAWLLRNAETTGSDPKQSSLVFPTATVLRVLVVAMLIVPVGMYFGMVRHCFAHSLYSGNLPIALASSSESVEVLEVWDDIQFPFPNVQKSYRDYFLLTGQVGDKLHIRDPRWGVSSHYYQINSQRRLDELTPLQFFATNKSGVSGNAIDDPVSIYRLLRQNTELMSRSVEKGVYAVAFAPDEFSVELLQDLKGMPNLEQIQLADCQISDDDLRHLVGLPKLVGLGLNGTGISMVGLKQLAVLPALETIYYNEGEITKAELLLLGTESKD
ncbi:MAG: hypothetical protein OSA89_14630 [Mariniblastus sp.]|nr:hypothetical protein [Mariniblastus sp.]